MGWGDVSSIAPVMPMILAKLFLLVGHTYQEAIFNADAFFYIVSVVGLYLLFRLKFSRNASITGSLIYATFTLLYSWVAIGGNDIIGVCGTIITVYLVMLAHKYNTKIYYVALPIAAYSFLSRYTAGIMIFSLVLYLVINKINLREIRDIIIGGVLGVISIGYFLNQFNKTLGTPFPFLGQFSGTVSNTDVIDSGYMPDVSYYIDHITNYLSSSVPSGSTFNALVNPMGNIPTILSYIYIALMILGAILLVLGIIKIIRDSDIKFFNKTNTILLALTVILTAIILLNITTFSYIVTFILVLIVLVLVWCMLGKYKIENIDYDLCMVSLFIIYIVFQSILSTKNDRYFITVLPFIAYFITICISYIYKYVDSHLCLDRINTSTVITILVTVFLVFNTLGFVESAPTESDYDDLEAAYTYLVEYDPDMNNETVIYSDNWPAVTWYLNIYTQRGVLEQSDRASVYEFSSMMLAQNDSHNAATYYIDTGSGYEDGIYPGMTLIKEFGEVRVYENTYCLENSNASLDSDEYISYYNSIFNRTGGYNETY
ncbi:MAG: glycosyltransferase family 39 protein [Methanosphaera sp.]|nr:glycosyltransferase family 39 protein [Methanosphaera sp.]